MVNDKKILISVSFIAAMAIIGIIAEIILLGFALIPLGLSFSFQNLQLLYDKHNEFYLANLLPLLLGISGYYIGKYYLSEKSKLEKTFSMYKKTIENIATFAQRIETGDLSYSYQTVNGEQVLSTSLENMRKSLLNINFKESERHNIEGLIAETNKLLRSITESHRLGDEIISFLVSRLDNVVQGAFYLVDDTDPLAKKMKMTSCYAYDRKKHLNSEFLFGHGLIGQAAMEKDFILRTEIPNDYATVTSGLIGHKKPKSILIVPLINNEIVMGAIELASISKFTDSELKFFSELSEIIARSINILKVNENTLLLLKESEKMRKNLAQKTKMMEKAEEMIATRQEELKRSNQQLEEQIQEVHNSNEKTQVLLENSLEVIFIYNLSGVTTYVSPSIFSVLGYYPDEINGKSDIENIHPLDTTSFKQFIHGIHSFPEKKHVLQYRYFTRSGEILWLEAIGKNSLNDVIRGIVIHSRDISEQRLAAKEQRIRAKMQALSENSTDLIMRIDIFSRCTYINPIIEKYTGLKIEEFLNKPINNIKIQESDVNFFKSILDEVTRTLVKTKSEIVFPTQDGNRIMDVSAIPEFYENGDIESVLFVCHDITESRKREELIVKKNKSIKDSINYAYYIQSSLMPTEKDLQTCWPNSFMFYKPKDIVSGDYPLLYQHDDIIYLGAMDCTGHGVPGALMSIIGYFLQSEIIRNNGNDNAGEILDKLHKNLVRTLRQDEKESMINDGMDAIFCKIDLKNKILNYAGAHRPLYYIKKGELTEIRGDRFPVGSSQYNNRKPFTNHAINISAGDAFILTTDGFADQYGGPNGKQKFMSGNVNLLLKENSNSSIFQIGKTFRKSHTDWKENNEQTDDILIIGLKF